MSKAGERLLRSARRTRAYVRGETSEGFVVHVPDVVDVGAIRARLQLSQAAFAEQFGFSVAAVRDWEQHRRQPEKAARILLRVIERRPDVVREVLAAK